MKHLLLALSMIAICNGCSKLDASSDSVSAHATPAPTPTGAPSAVSVILNGDGTMAGPTIECDETCSLKAEITLSN